jgi:ABC-type multidrug transport system ATPase subunit
VIALEGVAARQRPLVLARVTAAWGPGVHSLLGTRADGGALLLALVAGVVRARSGAVRVLDGSPRDPAVRRQIARVPFEVALPDAMRVDEALALAAALREEAPRPAGGRLAALGVEALAPRSVRSLSRPEARAVALAEAVTSTKVRVILVEEPLIAMDPRACARLTACLRARGEEGCAVVVDTASLRDAAELASDHLLLRSGAVVGKASSIEELASASLDGARIRIVTRDVDDGRALGAALAADADVQSIERQGASVVARGPSAARLARAAEKAILAVAHDVIEIRIDPPTLDEARVSAAALPAAVVDATQPRPQPTRGPA